ncbi:hypothetical protein SASPL_109428 [Salvia splendens]|uniref:Transmembrane protein n=1 Tax=Salvia splendens TaxID=180675 RepID=A0A8X8YH42_SALSN|nr:uncharacterized protein LOC121793420 [Salvia splendens]KAG6431349.1 hypothetical protein SASPL_109428 [Salvia splendens]
MDFISAKEREIVIDIDRFIDTRREGDENLGNVVSISVSVDENPKAVDEISPQTGNNSKTEKGRAPGKKKSSKPPRPPRGLSLDAADQKLIRELSELAMIKRAKIERTKVLKKMRAAKASSSSSASSSGNLMALLFTFIFFAVVVLQGCHSSGVAHSSNSAIATHGSLQSSAGVGVPLTSTGSPDVIMQPVLGPDIARGEAEKSVC